MKLTHRYFVKYAEEKKKKTTCIRVHITRSSFKFSSVAQLCPTLSDPVDLRMPCLPVHHNSWNLFKLVSIELVMPSSHLILC